jgi:hypothetical protein
MPHTAHSSPARARQPSRFARAPSSDGIESLALAGAPPIDDGSAAIDELAFLLATDHLSTLDMLLLDVASGEGLGTRSDAGVPLQQINKALSLLARHRYRH